MFRLVVALSLCIMISSCSWISRDYYYKNEILSEGWVAQHFSGRNGDKNGTHPAFELLTYQSDSLTIEMHVKYQDLLLFGPIVPFIPAPMSSNEKLVLILSLQSEDTVKFNPLELSLTNLDTGAKYNPVSVYPSSALEDNSATVEYSMQFPVGVRKLSNIEINIGAIVIDDAVVSPEGLRLKRIKGKTHFNQATL